MVGRRPLPRAVRPRPARSTRIRARTAQARNMAKNSFAAYMHMHMTCWFFVMLIKCIWPWPHAYVTCTTCACAPRPSNSPFIMIYIYAHVRDHKLERCVHTCSRSGRHARHAYGQCFQALMPNEANNGISISSCSCTNTAAYNQACHVLLLIAMLRCTGSAGVDVLLIKRAS